MSERDSFLAVAERISREIVAGAVWSDGRCNWVGAMPEDSGAGRATLSYRALGADLYGGTAGVGLLLAELARATGEDACRRTAMGALRHSLSRAGELARGSRRGLYSGYPGVALALALAGRALEEPELDDAARALVREHGDTGVGDERDLMSGSAGAICGLLALRALLHDERLLDGAVAHGEALLADSESAEDGLCWRSGALPGSPALTGFSHGAAGVAVALLELAAATGVDRYRAAAEGAFAYERTLYEPAARNWPDLRAVRRDGEATFAVFWCHGAPGGALARLRALELGGLGDESELREEARAALATTEAWLTSALESGGVNYSLCHGLAGNAEILLEGSALVPTGFDLAHRVAAAGIEGYLARGLPWPSGAYGGPTPCLFLGLAGIARFYLRLANPELPSLLLVRPDTIVL
jgi:lantibiotic biosynthesis protein